MGKWACSAMRERASGLTVLMALRPAMASLVNGLLNWDFSVDESISPRAERAILLEAGLPEEDV